MVPTTGKIGHRPFVTPMQGSRAQSPPVVTSQFSPGMYNFGHMYAYMYAYLAPR